MATGRYTKADVLKIVTDEGLRTAKGKPLTKQTFQAVLRNHLHAGWVTLPSDPDFEPVKGQHEPIVDQVTFDHVQAILDGRKPSVVAKRKINPVVPLRGFVKCEACGTPLTGGSCQGRSQKYPRYWCPKSSCLAVKLRKAQLENQFVELLGRVHAKPETISAFPKVAAKVWGERQGNSEREMKKLNARLEEQTKLKSELLRMRMRGELSSEEFRQAKAEHEAETYKIDEQLRALTSKQATADSYVRFAELQLVDMANVWRIAEPEQKHRVQKLLFGDGLAYSPEQGILNRSKSSLFSVLEGMKLENGELVGPQGLEP
jgi:site-specific DNA recombinase